jgi:hypothetical protein
MPISIKLKVRAEHNRKKTILKPKNNAIKKADAIKSQ